MKTNEDTTARTETPSLEKLLEALNAVYEIATAIRQRGTTSDRYHAGTVAIDVDSLRKDIANEIALRE